MEGKVLDRVRDICTVQVSLSTGKHGSSLEFHFLKKLETGTFLMVEWLRFHAPNSGGPGSIPDLGTRSHMEQLLRPQATTRESAPCNERYCIIQGRSHMP